MPVNKLSIQDFAAKIKAKYPDYKDIEDSLLTQKIIEKYPVYKDMVNYQTSSAAPAVTSEPPQKSAINFDLTQLTKGQKPVSESTQAPAIAIPQVSQKTTQEVHLDAVQNASNNLVKTFNENKDKAINKIVSNQWNEEFRKNNSMLSSGQIDQKTHDEREKNLLTRVMSPQQDVALFKQQMDADPSKVRQVVHEISKSDPAKEKQLQSDMYLLDSQNRPEKANKILSNIHGIQKGNTEYDIKKGLLKNKQGFFESLTSGLQERNRLMKDYDYYNDKPDEDVINKLEQNRTNYDPDQPVNAPAGAMGHIGGAVGSQGIVTAKGAVAGIGTAAIPYVGEVAAPWVAAAVTSPEFYKTGYTVSLENNYNEFRSHGDDPQTALSKARERAKFDANVDVAQGVVSTALGARMGLRAAKVPASPAFQNTLKNIAIKSGQWMLETGKEGVANAALATGLQELKNIHSGRPVEQGAFETGMGQLMFAYGLGALTKAGKALITPRARQTILHNMANAPEEVINEQLGHLVNDGTISHEEAGSIHTEIQGQKELDKKIPDQVENEGARIKIQELIKQRDELTNKMDGLDEAYHPAIKEQIKELNEKITDLSTGKGAKEEETGHTFVSKEDRNIQKQNEKIISGEAPPTEGASFLESRHADTKHDEQGVVSGPNDKELSTTGRQDANDLANDAKEHGVTKVISSDLERGKETARIVADKTGASVEHRPELNTWDIGDFDGTKDTDFKEIQKWFVEHPDELEYKGDIKSEKGKKVKESFNQYKDRVIEARSKLENEPGSTLVINHSNNIMLWNAFVKNGHQWNENAAKDYLNAQTPEPATILENKSYPKITNVKLKENVQIGLPAQEVSRSAGTGENIPGSGEGIRPEEQGSAPAGTRTGQIPEESTGQSQEEKRVGAKEDEDWPFVEEESDNEVTSIKNAVTKEKIEKYGLTPALKEAKRALPEVWDEAVKKIQKGFNPQYLVDQLKKKPRPLTDLEDALLLYHQATKEAELDSINKEINESYEKGTREDFEELNIRKAKVKDDLQDIYDVDKKAGTANARGLNARKMMVDRRFSLINMEEELKASNEGRPLTDEEKSEVEKKYNELKETNAKIEQRMSELEAENAALKNKAVSEPEEVKEKKAKRTRQQKSEERKQIIKDIRDDLLKAAKGGGGLTSSIPLAAQLKAVAPHIPKLVKNLVESGIDTLENVTKEIVGILKGHIPEITESHVHDLVAGEFKEAVKKASQPTKQAQIKQQAKQMKFAVTDPKLLKLRADYERQKASWNDNLRKAELAKRTTFEKGADLFVKWQRAFKLSGITTLAKLAMAGTTRLVSTPLEEIVGGTYSKILPKGVTTRATGEAGLNVKAEAKAITRAFTQGMKDSYDILRKKTRGQSDIEAVFGKNDQLPPEAIGFFGQLHSAIKAPVKRAAFERSLQKRMIANIENGVDVSDPMVQTKIAIQAYKDGQRAIFMQDNFVSDAYKRAINSLEKNKQNPTAGKALASGLQWLIPFVKVPTNIIGEVQRHATGTIEGSVRLGYQAMKNGLKNVSEEEADAIMRAFKKGSLGLGALALGYFNANQFGGFYQKGEKQTPDKLKAGEAKVLGMKIPVWLLESPLFQTMQLGATVRKLSDSKMTKEPKGLTSAMIAGELDLIGHEPLVEQPSRISSLFTNPKEREYFLGELVKGTLIPAGLSNIANFTDPAATRKPESILEHIETGIPGLREDVPTKSHKTLRSFRR